MSSGENLSELSAPIAAELLSSAWADLDRPADAGPVDTVAALAARMVTATEARDGADTRVDATFDAALHVLSAGSAEARLLVSEHLVRSIVCIGSHAANEPAIVAHLPAPLWQAWHQRHEELEARSISGRVVSAESSRLSPKDRARYFRAENGRLVDALDPSDPGPARRNTRLQILLVAAVIALVLVAVVRYAL